MKYTKLNGFHKPDHQNQYLNSHGSTWYAFE